MKTNASRLLETYGVEYAVLSYVVDNSDLSANYVARTLGIPSDQVFKTLLLSVTGGEFVFGVVPGSQELDLKILARLCGARRVEPVPVAKLQELTGYVRGAVTVLGAKRPYRVFVDEAVRKFDVISISAGKRGVQIVLKPEDFLRVTNAIVGQIAKRGGATENPAAAK